MSPVVVTADDFGLCPEVDDAICLLHDRGVVRRTSLLANTGQFEASVRALRARPGLDIAVHLNLTDGRPVLPASDVPTLVDRTGCFPGGRHYGVIAGIASGRISRGDIHREWRAQIVRVRDAGLTVCELNSHGHLHLLPHLHGVVLALRREFDIPHVRLVRSTEWPRGVLLQWCSRVLRLRCRWEKAPVAWPDRTVGLRSPGAVDPRIRLKDLKDPDAAIELIVHPSRGTNAFHERWGYAGDEVTNWLLAGRDGEPGATI